MGDKLRKLKDEAAKLFQKGKFDKALTVYQQILQEDAQDVTAQLKCGDIYRKLGDAPHAIQAYTAVATVYAEDGLLLKAIAACKLIMEIDPSHTDTQTMLADLYAKKTGRAAATPAAAPPRPPPVPAKDEVEEISDEDIVLIEESQAEPQKLPTIPLFSDLSKNAFIELMEQMQMHSVLPGETVIQEGAVDNEMYIISSGRVKVTKQTDEGGEMVLAHLTDGAFFGEMALLSQSPRTASVIAEEESLLFVVSREVLASVIKQFPSVKGIMLRFYRQRLLANLMNTSRLFKPLDNDSRTALIQKFKSREVGANQIVLEEGQKGDGLYLLLSGKVEIAKKIDGKRQVLAHLKEGEVFGEMSLLEDAPVNANVKTIRKSIVLKLPKRTFAELLNTHPHLVEHIRSLSMERQKTTDAIVSGKLKFKDGQGLVVV